MRERASRQRVVAFMRRLEREPGARGRIYLTGGASAVLDGWRETTVDIDVELEGEAERLLEPELYRYPAIDPATLRRKVAAAATTS